LKGGRYVRRLDVPLTPAGAMTVCVGLPAPGDWAVSLLHDRDRSGKFGAFTDGVGFANNPRLGLGAPPVAAATVRVTGVTPVPVRLLYLRGARPRPWPQ
jgi:uncharacterized protein (DUF2141 family)